MEPIRIAKECLWSPLPEETQECQRKENEVDNVDAPPGSSMPKKENRLDSDENERHGDLWDLIPRGAKWQHHKCECVQQQRGNECDHSISVADFLGVSGVRCERTIRGKSRPSAGPLLGSGDLLCGHHRDVALVSV